MNGIIQKNEDNYILMKQFENEYLENAKQLAICQERDKAFKEIILKGMEENSILKLEDEELMVSYIQPTGREKLDSKKLKEDLPDIYDLYTDITPVKSSIRIKVKK